MSLNNLQRELEAALRITEWSPTESQLRAIAKGLKLLGPTATRTDVSRVVLEVVGTYQDQAITLEGADNSDLT